MMIGATPGATAAGTECWVYFGTYTGAQSKGIYVSRLDANGQLAAPELAAEAVNPSFLAVDPQQKFLYAVNEVTESNGEKHGAVNAYAIDAATGKLRLLNQVSAITSGPCHVSVDATGRVVMAANYSGGSVESFPVRTDGGLGPAASVIKQSGSSVHPTRQSAPHAHCVGVDPANRFALLCDLGLDQVLVFKLDAATATLAPNDPPFARARAGAGPRHFAFGRDGKFVYVINELDCTMSVFAYDSERGALNEVQTLSTLPAGESVQPGFSTAEVVAHPSGKFLYGSNRGHDSIVVFAIDEKSGQLSLIAHVPSGGRVPRNFAIDPSGRFLVAANQESNNVGVFRIDVSTGRLASTGTPVTVGKPVCVVFVPVR